MALTRLRGCARVSEPQQSDFSRQDPTYYSFSLPLINFLLICVNLAAHIKVKFIFTTLSIALSAHAEEFYSTHIFQEHSNTSYTQWRDIEHLYEDTIFLTKMSKFWT